MAEVEPAQQRPQSHLVAVSALAFAMVMLPGIAVYAGLRAAGLGIAGAGLLGLLMMFVGLIAYPIVLRRTGWVGRR